jgi:hypothetical protein
MFLPITKILCDLTVNLNILLVSLLNDKLVLMELLLLLNKLLCICIFLVCVVYLFCTRAHFVTGFCTVKLAHK